MTTDVLLTRLYTALTRVQDSDVTDLLMRARRHELNDYHTLETDIAKIIVSLEQEEDHKMPRSTGTIDLTHACNNILKEAKHNDNKDVKEAYEFPFYCKQYQVFANTFRFIAVPKRNALSVFTNAYNTNPRYSGVKSILQEANERKHYKHSVKLPTMTQLRARITKLKSVDKVDRPLVQFNHEVILSAEYVLNCIKGFNPDKLYYNDTESPCYIPSRNNEAGVFGIIMPISATYTPHIIQISSLGIIEE